MKKIITALALSAIFAGCSAPPVVQPQGEIKVSYGKIINLREYVMVQSQPLNKTTMDISKDPQITVFELEIRDENGSTYTITQPKDSNHYYMGQRVEVTTQGNTGKVNPYQPK